MWADLCKALHVPEQNREQSYQYQLFWPNLLSNLVHKHARISVDK